MHHRRLLGFVIFGLTLSLTFADAQAWDDSKYPDLKGQWRRTESGDPTRFDPSKPAGLGQRALETTGLPLHDDNQTIVRERIYFDKAEPGILHDEITVIDNAFTRPWTITKNYRRVGGARPVWREHVCAEHNQHVRISNDTYFLSADGHLMPTKK